MNPKHVVIEDSFIITLHSDIQRQVGIADKSAGLGDRMVWVQILP